VLNLHEQNKDLAPEFDQYGMIIESSLDREDPWRVRVAIADTLRLLSEYMGSQDVESVFSLFIHEAALGDRSVQVRSKMLDVSLIPLMSRSRSI
jgi:hypothetical protein